MEADQSILFSIIIPTYNRSEFISRAIDSVIVQTYTNWELLIIDDGSTDKTAKIIPQYKAKDNRINYFRQENRGRSAARNLGIDHAQGHYICFLDDDDYYLDCFLIEFYREIIKRNSPKAVFICREYTEEKGRILKTDKNRFKYEDNLLKMYFWYSGIRNICTENKIIKQNRFAEEYSIGEDFHFFARLLLYQPAFYIDKYLCVYVIHEGGTMAGELREGKFLNKFNRLDVLDDLYKNHRQAMIDKGIIKHWYRKYLRIAYFYSSASLKKCMFRKSFDYLFKMKREYGFVLGAYYFISIIARMPFYWLKRPNK